MRVDLDWRIEDGEALPAVAEAAGEVAPAIPRRRRWRVVAITGFVFMVVAALGLWLIQDQGRRQLERDLRATILLEAQALARGDREIFIGMQDPDDPKWRELQRELLSDTSEAKVAADQVEVIALGVEDDWAWAEVRAPRLAVNIFRLEDAEARTAVLADQVQFYRRVNGRWLRAAPSDDFLAYWGAWQTLNAPHLRVSFFARDRPQIEAWLGTLAPYTEEVCLDLGCPPEMRLSVQISPTLTMETALQMLDPESKRVVLPSPHIIGIRQDYPLGESSAVLALGFSMMAIMQSSGSDFLFNDQASLPPDAMMLGRAVFYYEIDRAMTALALSELEEGWADVKEELLGPLLRGEWMTLSQFDAAPAWRLPEGQAWTLIEYVAQTHGRAAIGDLLRAVQTSASLAETLRVGLAVADATAFERGWRGFVEARLGRAMRDVPFRP